MYGGRSYDPVTGDISVISTGGSGVFGTFTKQDEALFNRQMAEAHTLAELEIMEYENFYNSPVEQAKRMRQAGLNPDLQNIDSMASASASPAGATAPQGTNNADVVSTVATTAFSAFNTAMSVVNGIQSFRSAQETLAGQQIDNTLKMDGFVTSYLVDQLIPKSVGDDLPYNSENFMLRDEVLDSLIHGSYPYAKNTLGLTGRSARRFSDSVYRKASSPEFVKQFYETMRDSESARQDYISKTTGDLYDYQDSTMRALLDELIRLQNNVYRSSLKSSKFESDYQGELYENLSGASFAEHQNMLYVNESSKARSEYYEKAFGRNLRKRWYNQYKNGNIFSGISLSLLGPVGAGFNTLLPMAVGMLK